jgi:hypothetical protein
MAELTRSLALVYCRGIRPAAAILLKAKCLLILTEMEEFAPAFANVCEWVRKNARCVVRSERRRKMTPLLLCCEATFLGRLL